MSETMTQDKLAAIKGRRDLATGPPWTARCVEGFSSRSVRNSDGWCIDSPYGWSIFHIPEAGNVPATLAANVAFVAGARADVDDLITEVERLREGGPDRAFLKANLKDARLAVQEADSSLSRYWDSLDTGVDVAFLLPALRALGRTGVAPGCAARVLAHDRLCGGPS